MLITGTVVGAVAGAPVDVQVDSWGIGLDVANPAARIVGATVTARVTSLGVFPCHELT